LEIEIDIVEKVSSHHRNFINNDCIKFREFGVANKRLCGFFHGLFGGGGRKFEEGMNSTALDVQSSHSCGSEYRDIFGRIGKEGAKQGGLSRSGFSGEEEIIGGFLHNVEGLESFFVKGKGH
jgi:hypothetical protein